MEEAIRKYTEQRRAQLNSIDDTHMGGGDTANEFRNLRIADKFPILNEWVAALTTATNDLIKTIKEVEKTMLNEDERMENAGAQSQSNDESKHRARGPVKRNKSKNKMLRKNSENNQSLARNTPAARLLLTDEMNGGKCEMMSTEMATATSNDEREVDSIGFCRNLLKKMFGKGKCDERVVRPDAGYGNGPINNVEFVYVDKSLCCMSTIINGNLTNTAEMANAETMYADFKATCAERMRALQNVTTAFQSSLLQQEELSAHQLQEIHKLRAQIKRLKKYRRSNRMLEANVKSICAENAHLLVEVNKIEKTLRLLRKRQPDNDHGTSQ